MSVCQKLRIYIIKIPLKCYHLLELIQYSETQNTQPIEKILNGLSRFYEVPDCVTSQFKKHPV